MKRGRLRSRAHARREVRHEPIHWSRIPTHRAGRRAASTRGPPTSATPSLSPRDGPLPCGGGARSLTAEHPQQAFYSPYAFPQAGAKPEPEEESPSFGAKVEAPKKERTPRWDWAGLRRRTFALDVLACVRCGGRRQVLASLTAPGGVRAIGEHLELPPRPAKRAAAQGPPQRAGC